MMSFSLKNGVPALAFGSSTRERFELPLDCEDISFDRNYQSNIWSYGRQRDDARKP